MLPSQHIPKESCYNHDSSYCNALELAMSSLLVRDTGLSCTLLRLKCNVCIPGDVDLIANLNLI